MKREKSLDSFLKVYKFTITNDDGSKYNREIVSRTNDGESDESVAVLLVDTDTDEFIMVKQPRLGTFKDVHSLNDNLTDYSIFECVAGTVDNGEEPMSCAIREVVEETGYEVDVIYPAVNKPLYVSPGLSTERLHLFFAKCSKKVSEGGGLESENENIEIVKYSASTIDDINKLMDSTVDMKTYILLNRYREIKFNS